ncbi:MAG: two-component system LytT family sensor kinase, partial [Saprospiraceae bacterium]
FEDNLTVEIDVSSNAINCKLPRLLLQPLVENAVKYGYGESGINVKITAERISDQLIIRIYDSGAEFGLDMQIGFGIKSVNQKLELLYPDQHTLEFKNSPAKHILIEINQNEV